MEAAEDLKISTHEGASGGEHLRHRDPQDLFILLAKLGKLIIFWKLGKIPGGPPTRKERPSHIHTWNFLMALWVKASDISPKFDYELSFFLRERIQKRRTEVASEQANIKHIGEYGREMGDL